MMCWCSEWALPDVCILQQRLPSGDHREVSQLQGTCVFLSQLHEKLKEEAKIIFFQEGLCEILWPRGVILSVISYKTLIQK